MSAQSAGDGRQLGRFPLDDRKIRWFVEFKIPPLVNLLHLTLANLVGGAADPAARQRRIDRGCQVKRMGKEIIS